ncbi:MAG: hemolysin family protein [Dehalococcoidia bacterium]
MITFAVLLVVLLVLSAFFSSSETAFLSIQRVRLAHMVAERVPGAARVSGLLERPTRLLSAILLGNNLVNTAAAAVGTALAARIVGGGEGIAIVIATVGVTVLLLVFGEVGPKTIALNHSFTLTRFYAIPMGLWVRVTRPLTWTLDLLTRVMLSLVGRPSDNGASLNAAELTTAIRLGASSGTLGGDASLHLLGALTLQRRQVQEIMVSRVDMVAIDADASLRAAAEALAEAGFLRLPVYQGSPDEVIGFLHVSDLNALQLGGFEGHTIREAMRPAQFESEHASIARVLEMMREQAAYLVMLVDEFGVTSGLVTLEDIMEEVVGELRSESGYEEEVTPFDSTQPLLVDGGTLLVDLSHSLDADLTEIDANTVAGLLLAQFKRFPEIGESMVYEGHRFTVMDADERRITKVGIELVGDDDPSDHASAGQPASSGA